MNKSAPYYNSNRHQARIILEEIIDYHNHNNLTYSEVKEAIDEIQGHIGDSDFNIKFDGNEYRIISDSDIWEIYVEEIKNIVEDCYDLKLDKVPDFIALSIDWRQTAKNAYADGYGHTFSRYDRSETETYNDYWIFRTN